MVSYNAGGGKASEDSLKRADERASGVAVAGGEDCEEAEETGLEATLCRASSSSRHAAWAFGLRGRGATVGDRVVKGLCKSELRGRGVPRKGKGYDGVLRGSAAWSNGFRCVAPRLSDGGGGCGPVDRSIGGDDLDRPTPVSWPADNAVPLSLGDTRALFERDDGMAF
jgi:hypothetical protein